LGNTIALEQCHNCERTIGKLEETFVFNNNIICSEYYKEGNRKMMKVYVNYPEPKLSIHYNPLCEEVQKRGKSDQRYIRINIDSVSTELRSFANKKYTFNSNAESNDMWLDIEFDDADFEISVLEYVHRLIGKHCAPLGKAKLITHC